MTSCEKDHGASEMSLHNRHQKKVMLSEINNYFWDDPIYIQFKIPKTRNRLNPKKKDQIWTKKYYPNQTIMRKTNKKGGKKKEGNLSKPLPSFSFFRPLLSLFPTTI